MSGRTIGVTLPIPEPYGTALDAVRARFAPRGLEMAAHVTVLAPIDVDEDVLPVVVGHLAAIAADTGPFHLGLAGVGTFRPVSPVVFVAIDAGRDECRLLEERVRSGDLAVEARFPYHPHVTIAHDLADATLDAAQAELADYRAEVPIATMALHERRSGAWRRLGDFAFGGEPAT